MKYLKIIASVFAILGFIHITYSAELSVESVDVIDANTISVILSENPNLEIGEIDWEMRVLHDMTLRGGFLDASSLNKVELTLEEDLKENTSYSLLSVSWSDGSIDFVTPDEVNGYSAINLESSQEQDIDSIEVIDDRTILVTYRQDLTENSFEYKLLAESKIVKIEKPDYFTSEIVVSVESPFVSNKNYILMFIELQDVEGNYLEFDTGIYDFVTPDISSIKNQEEQEEIQESEILDIIEIPEVIIPNEVVDDFTPDTIDEEIELNAAGLQEGTLWVLQAAQEVTHTPQTGAQTWFLVVATLFINSFYYLSRRKKLSRVV